MTAAQSHGKRIVIIFITNNPSSPPRNVQIIVSDSFVCSHKSPLFVSVVYGHCTSLTKSRAQSTVLDQLNTSGHIILFRYSQLS